MDMTGEQNWYQSLRAGEIDSAELSEIALWHFHSARDVSPTEVVFGLSPDLRTYALKFVYKKQKRNLTAIFAGPALKSEDISALRAKIDLELQEAPTLKVATQVLFTHIPVTGCFRYRDMFQMLPIPTGSPSGDNLYGGIPFLVQFTFRPSYSQSMLHGFRRSAAGRRIQLLLNALLEVSISRIEGSLFHWARIPTDELGPISKTAYCQEMYDYPDSQKFRDSDSFVSLDEINPLIEIDPQEYYTRASVLDDPERVLEIPANLENLLDRFFSSSAIDQDRFLRACFWFNHARIASPYSDSAAFMALIVAIESLMPSDKPASECPICKRPTGRGAKTRLVEFLDELAPATPKFQDARAALYYAFRSRLSHGGELLFVDRTGYPTGLTPEAIKERNLRSEVWQLVKIILVNWLYSRQPLLVTVDRG